MSCEGPTKSLKLAELSDLIETQRQEQMELTSALLEELDYSDSKHIKRLYNYNLARLREKLEIRDDQVE